MSETPLEPTPVVDALLRTGEGFGRPSRRRHYLLVLLVVIVLAAAGGFFLSRNSGHPARLDRSAVAVTDAFTRRAWNRHNCQGASRYLSNAELCSLAMIPAWQGFSLASHRIRETGCRQPSLLDGGVRPSRGCITYRSNDGLVIRYGMTKTSRGWLIVEIGTSGSRSSTPGPSARPGSGRGRRHFYQQSLEQAQLPGR